MAFWILSGITWLSQYLKGKANLHFTEERDREWQWHDLVSDAELTIPFGKYISVFQSLAILIEYWHVSVGGETRYGKLWGGAKQLCAKRRKFFCSCPH